MNLQIFYDKNYYNKINELLFIYETNPIFPFEDLGMAPDKITGGLYDATNVYNFLKTVKFIYYLDQRYVGYVKIDGVDYIIDVDSEINITILGDNEFNWVKCCVYEDQDYEDFKQFCFEQYKTTVSEPDYDKFAVIERNFLNF